MCGCLVQFVTSLPVALEGGGGVGGLSASMILIGIGAGGVKATFSPFLGRLLRDSQC
jgi:POT family proton-dependent oligopeptide transporter